MTIPTEAAIATLVFVIGGVAGLCGWLTRVSIDIGKILSSTEHRIGSLEEHKRISLDAIIDHDRRIGRLEAANESKGRE